MTLLLRVVSYTDTPPSRPIENTFQSLGGSIGRGSQCDWVLDDPDKFLSGQHATIEFTPPHYYLTDTSSNGVYINQSNTPLGKGNSVRLSNGDTVEMGEYVISVTLTESSSLASNPSGFPFSEADAPDVDPFAGFGPDLLHDVDINEKSVETGWHKANSDNDPFEDWESNDESQLGASEPDNVSPLNAFFPPDATVSPEASSIVDEETAAKSPFDFPGDWSGPNEPTPGTKPEDQSAAPATETPRAAPPQEERVAIGSSIPTQVAKHSSAEFLDKFYNGVGIEKGNLESPLDAEVFFLIGKVLRTTVQGAMDVLMARSEIKNEMRLDVTTLRSTENNPIKFSFSVDEALQRLLSPQRKGYMLPAQAVEEAFEDIRAHQIAVLAGMQTALHSILKRFDPKTLEQRLHKTSPIGANIPIHRQAKLWDLFEQLYEDIEHEAQDDFNQLFGHAFSKAYEKQIKEIKSQGPHNPIE